LPTSQAAKAELETKNLLFRTRVKKPGKLVGAIQRKCSAVQPKEE